MDPRQRHVDRIIARYRAAKSPWGPLGRKLQWIDAGEGQAWARFKTNDSRQYTHKYRIVRRATAEWVVNLETPDGSKTVGAERTPNLAKQLAQEHMERTVRTSQ